MHIFLHLFDLLLFTCERIWQHRVLVFWVLLGLSAATTLALSLILYIDAVNTRVLASRLPDPPFAYRFRYLGSWEGNITQADVESASAAIDQQFIQLFNLPVSRQAHYVSSGVWSLRIEDGANLGAFGIGFLEGAEDQLTITAGEWPPSAVINETAVPILLPEALFYTAGIQIGDTLLVARPGVQPVTVEVVAFWRAAQPTDPNWIFPPRFFDQVALIQPDDLWSLVEAIDQPIEEGAWQIIFDGNAVRTSEVDRLLASKIEGERSVTAVLPGIRLDVSPTDGLTAFSREVELLTNQLILVILPVGGLILYFVSIAAGLLVGRQQAEDVTLRSRGMSRGAILLIHVLMWLLLVAVALAIAVLVGPLIVLLVGQTRSFMQFDDFSAPLYASLTPEALSAGVITGLIAASTGLWLAWQTTSQTITSFKQKNTRLQKAWWQRAYLDVLLLIPAFYSLFVLWQRGGLKTEADNPFNDPLAFLGPTLFSLGLTLMFLRLWRWVLNLGAGLVGLTANIPLLMALRELTRSAGRYRSTLIMMCFTLSLTGFTASLASTLDRSLKDTIDYRIGADAVVITATDAETEQSGPTADSAQQTVTVTGYNLPPTTDLLQVADIQTVTPVKRFPGQLQVSGQRLAGTVLGVDRTLMASVTRFRVDYAPEPLADLMNRLAGNRTGILLSMVTAETYNIRIGQEVTVQVSALGEWYPMTVPVVGLINYFPTLDPSEGFFAITNLQPLFETVGTPLPQDLWLGLRPGADSNAIRQAVRETGFPVIDWHEPAVALQTAQAAPSRRGVLGFLSVGFVASIFLTMIGAIIQGSSSFRAQAVQLGSLRAMGLGSFAVNSYMILVQGIAAASGILSGTLIGVATTLLFLPLLDFSGGLPPYLVRVAWDEIATVYGVFAWMLFLISFMMTIILGRENLSTLIKMGDV